MAKQAKSGPEKGRGRGAKLVLGGALLDAAVLLGGSVLLRGRLARRSEAALLKQRQEQEAERLRKELELAKTIQLNMLPSIFPAFPERKEFELFAGMEPAKELGGDFYDFYMIDRDHVAIVIADVSGKGIPAAMLMMASKIMVNNTTKNRSRDAAKVLNAVNRQMQERNPENMFVTLWMGILEISTGKLSAANAGHEYPCLKRSGGEFALFKDPHGLVLGAMEDTEYDSYEIQLKPGDTLFVYTDGVTEATDAAEEMFGTGRLVEALNINPDAPVRELLGNVRLAVDRFVKDAPTADDMTMLALQYFGAEGRKED